MRDRQLCKTSVSSERTLQTVTPVLSTIMTNKRTDCLLSLQIVQNFYTSQSLGGSADPPCPPPKWRHWDRHRARVYTALAQLRAVKIKLCTTKIFGLGHCMGRSVCVCVKCIYRVTVTQFWCQLASGAILWVFTHNMAAYVFHCDIALLASSWSYRHFHKLTDRM